MSDKVKRSGFDVDRIINVLRICTYTIAIMVILIFSARKIHSRVIELSFPAEEYAHRMLEESNNICKEPRADSTESIQDMLERQEQEDFDREMEQRWEEYHREHNN